MKRIWLIYFGLVCSCSKEIKVEQTYPNEPILTRQARAGKLFGDLKMEGKMPEKPVNTEANKIWSTSVSVISEIFPIKSIDKDSGIIVTDWGNTNLVAGKILRAKIVAIVDLQDYNNITINAFIENAVNAKDRNDIEGKIKDRIVSKIHPQIQPSFYPRK